MTNHAGAGSGHGTRATGHGPNISVLVLLMTMLITAVTGTIRAKSLYIIADIHADPTPIQAYDITAYGTLTFQAEYGIPYHGSYGAVGLAIDSDSKTLFVTYEQSNVIQLIDATTMTDTGTTTASGARNLAGIVYDHDKGLLYCVDRNTNKLYVYDWEANTATLTGVPGSPFTLTGATAYGIALDEINDLLYVANISTTINVYHTSDWSSAGTISVRRAAISIAVDATRGFVYSGGGFMDNYYLTQYSLDTHIDEEVQVEPDAGVMGLGVDPATGLIYVGTGANNKSGGDNLKVYDTSLNQIDIIEDIGNPTGLVIPIEDVSYNPLNLSKNIAIGAGDKAEHVEIGGTITYTICFDNKNNHYIVNNVSLIDTLPNEVSFVTASGDGVFGQYDPITHTYRWSYSSLSPGFSGACLKLVVQVKQATAPGTTITNSVTIDSDETGPTTASVDVITEAISYNPLNLSKNIIGGNIEQSAACKLGCVGTGDTIIYGICFDNNNNDYPVSNVSIIDTLPDEVSFVTADGDGRFGQYDPITHTYIWSYSSLPSRFPGDCLKLVVQVNQAAIPGTIITNSVTIDSDETGPTKASVDVFSKAISYNPLNLSKNIICGNIEQSAVGELGCVSVDGTIIYGICFDNKDNDYTVTNVSIVDILPKEVSFVTADGDGIFGQYDAITHTYRWSYPFLLPGFSGDCLTLVARVNQGTAPGTTITNSVIIHSNETGSATASVDVTCERLLEAALTVRPNMIRRDGCCDSILAIVELPQGIGNNDIKDEPLILSPGSVTASRQFVFGTADKAQVHAWFDTCELLAAVPGYGEVRVRVVGKLKSCRSFFAEDVIYITKFSGN